MGLRRDQLEAKLVDPEVYNGSTTTLMEIQIKLGNVKLKLSEAENSWMQASEELERAG